MVGGILIIDAKIYDFFPLAVFHDKIIIPQNEINKIIDFIFNSEKESKDIKKCLLRRNRLSKYNDNYFAFRIFYYIFFVVNVRINVCLKDIFLKY